MPFDFQPIDETLRCLMQGRERVLSGWNKGHATPEQPYCAVHACMHNNGEAGLTAAIFLDAHVPEGPWRRETIHFNDYPETTHADILALFDRAINARRAELLAEQVS